MLITVNLADMKLIKPSYEILPQSQGLDGIHKQIEVAGRTCYKSSDKITPDSAKGFVERMIASDHGAILEHGTVYLDIPPENWIIADNYKNSKYSIVRMGEHFYSVTTNYRVLVENNWLNDLQYICEPTEFHERRISVKFILDRGISHEYVRHRVFSFAQESTRYCNYSKDKFGNELTFIEPIWFNKNNIISYSNKGNYPLITNDVESRFPNVLYELQIEEINEETRERTPWSAEDWFIHNLKTSELGYFKLLEQGWKPQQARSILPNSLKTELVMTGFVSDWKHFFSLRNAEAAHPQARELAKPLHEEFVKNKWL